MSAKSDTLELNFDSTSGKLLKVIDISSSQKKEIQLNQDYLFYEAYEGEGQKDGAYIFRPSDNNPTSIPYQPANFEIITTEGVVTEIHQSWSHWVNQTIRLWWGCSHLEIDYSIGPVPIQDRGKNVITRFFSSDVNSNSTFFTDSNGREFQKRIKNHRPSWPLEVHEPVAGNYYPMNAA